MPTWNYAIVHAYGKPRVVEDPAWLKAHVTQLTAEHESGRTRPWQVSDAPADFVDQMIARIVGIELPLSRIEGKWKVSQNRKLADRLGVIAGLESQATAESLAMTELVRECLKLHP